MSTSSVLLLQIAIDGITVVLSIVGAAFASGLRVGRIETTLTGITERLAKIEGMFTLRLKGRDDT